MNVRYAYAGRFAPVQVAYKDGSGEDVYDVHSDHLDTPRMLTDEDDVPVWRANYEAFGRAHISTDPDGSVPTTDPGIDFNIRFPGQYADAESGLHDNRHRVYDPAIGRYISADPIGQLADSNVYRYALPNPLSLVDPLGLAQYLILVGQQGQGGHNVGNNFQRAANTQAADLIAAGHSVTVTSVGSVADMNAALTSGATIDGGVIYFGHGWTGALYPGQNAGPGTNVTSTNASSLNGSNLAPGASVTLNSCNAGTGGPNSIAQAIANAVGAATSGYASPTGFSASPTGNAPSAPGSVPPSAGPIYVRPARGGGPVTYAPTPAP